jgi:Tfp pilus assembly protein PilF
MNDHALLCYESVLRNNQFNSTALDAAAQLHRSNGHYAKAIDLYQQILNLDNTNGRAWASVAHCYVCVDELHKAYTAYQQALIHIREPHDPFLWYGIGVLYDRYGSADHAREAFEAVLSMAPTATFDRHAEVRFRLAMLNKQRRAYTEALDHLRAIVDSPPAPLTTVDVVCHIARVEELRGNFPAANMAYQRALELDPNSAKTLQQFAWYCHTRAVDTTAHFDTAPPTTADADKPTPTALSTAAVPARPIDAVVAAASAMAAVGSGDVTMAEMTADAHNDRRCPRTRRQPLVGSVEAETTTVGRKRRLRRLYHHHHQQQQQHDNNNQAATDDRLPPLPPPPSSADDGITTAAAALVEAAAADKVTPGTKTAIDASVQADIAKLHERAEALLEAQH